MLPYSCVMQKKSCAPTSTPPSTDDKCSFTHLITSLNNVSYEAKHNLTDKHSSALTLMLLPSLFSMPPFLQAPPRWTIRCTGIPTWLCVHSQMLDLDGKLGNIQL